MKKIFLIVVLCILVCGCVDINKSSIDEILTDSLNSELKFYNTNRNGYKYYINVSCNSLSSIGEEVFKEMCGK